jgi:peptidoglycan/LPS O-acetylase OafA/YrhL
LLHPIGLLFAAILLGLSVEGPAEFSDAMTRGLLGFGFSLALSIASYYWLEMPFLQLKKRFAHIASGSP